MTELTDELAFVRHEAEGEYQRFLDVQFRELPADFAAVRDRLRGARVMITGGTGCIGSALVRAVADFSPDRIISVTRGLTVPRSAHRDAHYLRADVRDLGAMTAVMQSVRPDVVFHLAAIRDPGEAQSYATDAITTNLLGTHTVLEAAREAGVANLVYASSGKAVRYYTRDVYAATKKVGEAMMTEGSTSLGVGIARFTHVVDNSLIHHLLRTWLRDPFLRLHDPHIAMYAQSAAEAAQLLLLGVTAQPGRPKLYSLRNLEFYFELVDIALGMRRRAGSSAALWFTGFPAGYDSRPHPAQYDPTHLGDTGPLVNTLEVGRALPLVGNHVNEVAVEFRSDGGVRECVRELLQSTQRPGARPDFLRHLDQAGVRVLATTFANASSEELSRLHRLRERDAVGTDGSDEHAVIDLALQHAIERDDLFTAEAV